MVVLGAPVKKQTGGGVLATTTLSFCIVRNVTIPVRTNFIDVGRWWRKVTDVFFDVPDVCAAFVSSNRSRFHDEPVFCRPISDTAAPAFTTMMFYDEYSIREHPSGVRRLELSVTFT